VRNPKLGGCYGPEKEAEATMTINLSIPDKERELKPRIVVVGMGGAGGNAVNNMIAANLEGVEFLACNTDAQALSLSKADRRIQLGLNVTHGLGAGSRPDVGRAATEEGLDEILDYLDGSHMVFITAGMGGGTGTGGAPVLARTARERGILTVGVVTKPFHFEGQHRMRIADQGIDAFSWLGPDRPFVILDTGKGNRARSRFDAAHELGHLVMHRERARAADRDLEKQAHRFASAFLLPARQLEAEWPTGRLNWRELMTLKRRWQMSLAALLYRARQDELLSPTAYESAVKYISRAGWRKREPVDLGPPERPRLLRRAVRALEDSGISRDDLVDEAHIPLALIDEYVTMPGSSQRVSVEL